jgi:hypothetical protein
MSLFGKLKLKANRPFNLVYGVISPFAVKRAPLYRGLPYGIYYYGIKYKNVSAAQTNISSETNINQ